MAKLLSDIENGKEVNVISIASSILRVKLLEMGLLEGETIRVLFRAPLGDPIAIDVNGYVLSLRLSEARLVAVREKDSVEA
jgi:Fe2+ transport system protein FeoA